MSDVQRLAKADGGLANTWMVLGEVVGVHIDKALLHEGVYATATARPILRGGGSGDYFEIGDAGRFHMRRP